MGFLSSLRASIEDLVEALVEPGSNILEEEAQLQAAGYVCCEVLPTLQLYYRSHYSPPSTKGESRAPQQRGSGGITRDHEQEDDEAYVSPAQFGEELAQLVMLLGQEAAGLETVLPPKAVVDCLEAMASANLCAMSATSPASPKQLGRPDSAGTGALVPDEGPELAGDLPEIAGDYPAFGRGSGALAAEEPHPQERIGGDVGRCRGDMGYVGETCCGRYGRRSPPAGDAARVLRGLRPDVRGGGAPLTLSLTLTLSLSLHLTLPLTLSRWRRRALASWPSSPKASMLGLGLGLGLG